MPVQRMESGRFDKLTERQKQCLRLFAARHEAKEIGRVLSLSPHTVNQHLRDARTILGVPRSIDAARLLVTYERNNCVMVDPVGIDGSVQVSEIGSATEAALPQPIARNRNPFGYLSRIGLIVAIAFGAVALAGATLVGSTAITHVFRAERIDISDYPYRQ